jgi:hypothetical protein
VEGRYECSLLVPNRGEKQILLAEQKQILLAEQKQIVLSERLPMALRRLLDGRSG